MRFSIITITFNAEATLPATLASIAAQSFKDFEHIVIDGNSTDRSAKILEKYRLQNPDHVHIHSVKPQGISHAMNEGIEHARGEYVMHIHADDVLYDNNVLKDMDAFLKTYPVDWMYGAIEVINERDESCGTFPNKRLFQATSKNIFKSWLLQLYNYIPHQAVAIRKSVFRTHGMFDEHISSAMDPDLWLRIRTKTSWMYMPRLIAKFRLHEESQTGSKKKQKENREHVKRVQKKHLGPITYILARIVTKMVHAKQYE